MSEHRPPGRMPLATVLNGPNMNMLGPRKPARYGADTLDSFAASASADTPWD